VQRLLHRLVVVPGHDDVLALKKGGVAGRTVAHPPAQEFLLAPDAPGPAHRAGGQHYRAGGVRAFPGEDDLGIAVQIDGQYLILHELRAEGARLIAHGL